MVGVQRGGPERRDAGDNMRWRVAQLIRRLAKRSETTHEKGDGHGCDRNVGALNQQLESGPVGTQDDVLATADVDQDVLQARQGRDKDTPVLNA